MFDQDQYPYVSSYQDRHGKTRWRYRHKGKTVSLPEPTDPAFDESYRAAVEGRAPRTAEVRKLPTAAEPRSFKAAWRILITNTPEWKALDPETRRAQTLIAERFLLMPVVEGEPLTFGDCAVADLRRRHIKALLARKSATPHAAGHLLRLIRKLTGVALDEEWIEYDPTFRLRYRPAYKGWQPWSQEAMTAFKKRWKNGTTPRAAYALARWFGHRRSDCAAVKWTDLEQDGGTFTQQKKRKNGRKTLWIPMHPELRAALKAMERRGEYVLMTQYDAPFSVKALGMRMQDWTAAAGLPPGHTLHGLRKTLGADLAESDATTKQVMAILGHDDMKHAELYTASAEQKKLAKEGMKKLFRKHG